MRRRFLDKAGALPLRSARVFCNATSAAISPNHQEETMIPADLWYHQEHEWVRVNGMQATMGISHFAQDALGDIVFIDLPKVGVSVTAGQQIGEVESTKTTST